MLKEVDIELHGQLEQQHRRVAMSPEQKAL